MAHPPPKLRWAIFIGLACLALAIRLPRLSERPMHTDEAVNGYITGQLLSGGSFQYDPKDRHGPALSAATLPVVRLFGARSLADLNETMLRIVPVIFGALTVFGFAFITAQVGLVPAALAALLFAIGPLPLYYNRYFIHETLFVMATLGVICAWWRLFGGADLSVRQDVRQHVPATKTAMRRGALIGAFAAIMLACKETAVLHFAAFGAAGVWWMFATRRQMAAAFRRLVISAGIAASVVFLLMLVVLYSWGGTHWQGISDLVRSVPNLASRASGEGHEKPFWYYFTLLGGGWSGVVVLVMAVIGAVIIGAPGTRSARANESKRAEPVLGAPMNATAPLVQSLLVYTIVIFALYSAIPYKTPWLALNLWLPLAIFAGVGFSFLQSRIQGATGRGMLAAGMAALIALLAHDDWHRVYMHSADEHNPYAYAHTVDDVVHLPDRISELARKESKETLRIAVIAADPWPLPWYLRKFPEVGFWQPLQEPDPADIYITSPEVGEKMALELARRRPEFIGIRPEVLMILWPPPEPQPTHE